MSLPASQKIAVSTAVLSQEVSGETVLLDLASEQYFGLDAVGTRIWQLLNQNQSIGEVKAAILAEYDVSQEQLEADIEQLFAALLQAGLITLEPAGGQPR